MKENKFAKARKMAKALHQTSFGPALPNENQIFWDENENIFLKMNRLFQDENRKEKKKIIPQGRARTNIANSFPGIRIHACLCPLPSQHT